MAVEYVVVSIGTLSHNPFWGERAAVRAPHATTTLVISGERRILVDPSLPAAALAARYSERTGGKLADVTDVFCTTLRPTHRRGIEAMGDARWWAGETEIETYGRHLESLSQTTGRLDPDQADEVESEIGLIGRFRPAPDRFDEQVHVVPLAGPSEGATGLLLTPPTRSVLVAGDAAVTAEHVRRGRVWEGCADREAALSSMEDILELADLVVPGHDNIMLCPRTWF